MPAELGLDTQASSCLRKGVGKNNALNSQTKSTRGNDFQMPEENVSNSNSECIFTHASQILQALSHLFSDFLYIYICTHTHINCSKASSILELEETNIFILNLQS